MAIDAIIRVSFESDVNANQAANKALVGHTQNPKGPGPFERVGTALYQCSVASDHDVGLALRDLGAALQQFSTTVDFVSISMLRHKGSP